MFQPMLAHQYHKYRDRLRFPVLVQPKLDGIRLLWDGYAARSRTGKSSINVPPAIDHELTQGWLGVSLDGELYCPNMTFEQIVSVLRRQTPSPEQAQITYHVFDTPSRQDFKSRYRWLRERMDRREDCYDIAGKFPFTLVPTWSADSLGEIDLLQAKCLDQGYEGVMVRDPLSPYEGKRTSSLLKYKKIERISVIVIGFKEGKGKHVGRLGALQVQGPNGCTCWVGTGFSDKEREDIWAKRPDQLHCFVDIEYQEKTTKGVPRFPRYLGPTSLSPTEETDR